MGTNLEGRRKGMGKVKFGVSQGNVSGPTSSSSPAKTTSPASTSSAARKAAESAHELPEQTKAKIKADKVLSGIMKRAIYSGTFKSKSTTTPKPAPRKDMDQALGMDPSKPTMELKFKDNQSYQDMKSKMPAADPHVQFNDAKKQIHISYPPAVAADKLPKPARSAMESMADAKLRKDGKYNDFSDAKQSTRFEEAFATSKFASTRKTQLDNAKSQSKNFKYNEFDQKFSPANRQQLKSDIEGKTS